jgi:hypothetical protein
MDYISVFWDFGKIGFLLIEDWIFVYGFSGEGGGIRRL